MPVTVPDELRYTPDHEWLAIDGDLARIGITDFAQRELGDVVYVDLPVVDRTVVVGELLCEVESTKASSEVLSPLGGRVVQVNDRLRDDPHLINQDPYGEGWICVLLHDGSGLTATLSTDQYLRELDA